MDPLNAELYRLALADAPFVVAAYTILWVALVVYIGVVLRRLMRLEREVAVLEESMRRRDSR